MSTDGDSLGVLTGDEERLVRLFRLATVGRRAEVIRSLYEEACSRYSLAEWFGDCDTPEARQEWLKEEVSMTLDERMLRTIPWDWPNRTFDWDTLGDPNAVFDNYFNGSLEGDLLTTTDDDDSFVEELFDMYVSEADTMFGPMYECVLEYVLEELPEGRCQEEAREKFDADFRAELRTFIKTWRDCLVALLERRIALPPRVDGEDEDQGDGEQS